MKNLFFSLIAIAFSAITYSQENPKNEFDYMGKIHNEVILEFIKNNSKPALSIDEVLTNVKPVILSNNTYKQKFGSQYSNLKEEEVRKYMPDIANNFSTLVNDQKISSEAKKLLNELLGFINNSSEYNTIFKNVIAFEDKVLESNIVKSEKELILSSSSIARYSSYLWLVQKPKTPNDTTASRRRGFWIILADVGGGILGSGGGLAGTVAGAAAGSLIAEQVTGKGN